MAVLHRLLVDGVPIPAELKTWAIEQCKRPTVQAFVARERKV